MMNVQPLGGTVIRENQEQIYVHDADIGARLPCGFLAVEPDIESARRQG